MKPPSPNDVKNNTAPTTENTQTKMSPEILTWWSTWADRLGIFTAVVGGAAALAGMIGFGFSWKSGKLKDEDAKLKEEALELYKSESTRTIADAKAQSDVANNEAAKANERAAMLEKEAEAARLETQRVKEKLAWRSISEKEGVVFIKSIKSKIGKVLINYTLNDPESANYAMQLSELFAAAGWKASVTGHIYSNGLFHGLTIPKNATNPEGVGAVRGAFHAATLESAPLDMTLNSAQQMRQNPSFDADPSVIRIWVGTKVPFDPKSSN